jgi:nucleotidyltransferase substrate binding protein (TIGR01987 family)
MAIKTTILKKALDSLEIGIQETENLTTNSEFKLIARDGVIQRFEYTFELAWKTLKRYLEEHTLEAMDGLTARDLFRRGFEEGLLQDSVTWVNLFGPPRHKCLGLQGACA